MATRTSVRIPWSTAQNLRPGQIILHNNRDYKVIDVKAPDQQDIKQIPPGRVSVTLELVTAETKTKATRQLQEALMLSSITGTYVDITFTSDQATVLLQLLCAKHMLPEHDATAKAFLNTVVVAR